VTASLKFLALRTAWLLLLPLLILMLPQAIYVKKRTLRLPEAKGPRKGTIGGDGCALRILHVGESTVAGVGVTDIKKGFTAYLAASIHQQSKRPVKWQVLGVNGIRLNALLMQLQQQPLAKCDIAVVTMGVNDTTKFTPLNKWRQQLHLTIKRLLSVTQGRIIFTQVPAMEKFPALPAPLKYLLGLRAQLLDMELQRVCNEYENVHYVLSTPNIEPQFMAKDGYHPSEEGYQEWAHSISPSILERIHHHDK
jgi:lysophospholipase L1-like esterase